MYFVLLFLVIIMVLLALVYKSMEVDIMLKYYELCGKKVETMRGQVVWITGASSGIGEHLAYKMASVGCKLVLSSRRKEQLERVKTKCLGEGKNLNIPNILQANDIIVCNSISESGGTDLSLCSSPLGESRHQLLASPPPPALYAYGNFPSLP